MLDIKFVRENPDLIKEAVRKKHLDFNVDELVEIDIKRLEILSFNSLGRALRKSIASSSKTTSHIIVPAVSLLLFR